MKTVKRELSSDIKKASFHFGAIVLTGPRRAGKTFLLSHAFPRASYHLLEDPDLLDRVRADPRGWLEEIKNPAIIDEIQNAPELLSYIRTYIDQSKTKGQWILTGSQEFALMKGVSESLAGRAAVFQLLPFSYLELKKWNLVLGSFPEVIATPSQKKNWFRSYLQTYLERDVRSLIAIKDLPKFRRFLSLLASRHGQMLNKTDLAGPLGLSVPTLGDWLSVLETTGHILLIPPYFENFGKRLIKSPKLYWVDSGLVCFLLGIDSMASLEKSPFLGQIFEGFLAAEIVKNQLNRGQQRDLYYFRDQQGLEVDFLLPGSNGVLHLIEAKWSKTVTPAMATSLLRLRASMGSRQTSGVIVHRSPASKIMAKMTTLTPGVNALSVEDFLEGSEYFK